MALTQWQLKPVETDSIASGDFLAFADESETGDPINKITIDNLATFLAGGANLSASAGVLTATATALDDVATGDAASTLATSTGNITIDAQGNDTDIIFKGTDNTSDITMLTLAGADAGKATFNGDVSVGTSLQTATIDFTDGDLAMTIADGGGVTFSQQAVFSKDILIDSSLASDGDYSGITASFTAGEALVVGECVYLKASDSRVWKAVSVVSGTGLITAEIMCIGVVAADQGSAGQPVTVLLQGFIRSTNFPTYAVGETLYVPEAEHSSNNVPEGASPDTTGDFVQVLGWAVTTGAIYVNPDFTIIEHA